MVTIIGVRFRTNGKVYYFDPSGFNVKAKDHVIVETARGVEYGEVALGPREVDEKDIKPPLKPIIRIATYEDFEQVLKNKESEKDAYRICLEKIKNHGLNMKLIESEYTFDRGKLLFYFTADGRIDFRELVKDLAAVFRTRIELRQIGIRDETKMIGGFGICGRPLCCSTFLTDFSPVSIKMAKDQGLSLNPSKISGVCGRLMCCLQNEEEAYLDLNRSLPPVGSRVKTIDGFEGEVQRLSVLKQRVTVLIETDAEEKEVREYSAKELEYNNKSGKTFLAQTLPDETLDEEALRELQKMESEDIKEMAEAESIEPEVSPRSKRSEKGNRNKQNNFEKKKKKPEGIPNRQNSHSQKPHKNNKNSNPNKGHKNSQHFDKQNSTKKSYSHTERHSNRESRSAKKSSPKQ